MCELFPTAPTQQMLLPVPDASMNMHSSNTLAAFVKLTLFPAVAAARCSMDHAALRPVVSTGPGGRGASEGGPQHKVSLPSTSAWNAYCQ